MYRYLLVQTATYHMLGLRQSTDIIYNPIPLYHMSGGIVGTGCALVKGIPSVLRTKFSVSAYWTDCIKYNCTVCKVSKLF
jgi:solute carrier family 27 fatty acid transporter 1/4